MLDIFNNLEAILEIVCRSKFRKFSDIDGIIIKAITEHFTVLKLVSRNTYLGLFLAWIKMGF